jgi:hypothetical protein
VLPEVVEGEGKIVEIKTLGSVKFGGFGEFLVGLFVVLSIEVGKSQGVERNGVVFLVLTGLVQILDRQFQLLDLSVTVTPV